MKLHIEWLDFPYYLQDQLGIVVLQYDFSGPTPRNEESMPFALNHLTHHCEVQ